MRLKGTSRVGVILEIEHDFNEVIHYVHGIPQFILVRFPKHGNAEAVDWWCAPTQLKKD